MATTLFDRSLFVQRKRYIEEVASLEDAFDLLEGWPADQRGVAHEVLMEACQQAHAGRFPLRAFRANLECFLKRANVLAKVQDLPELCSSTAEEPRRDRC